MPAFQFWGDVLKPYLGETSIDRKPSTQEAETYHARRLREFFEGYWICDKDTVSRKVVTPGVVKRYREWRKMQGVTAQTAKRELALASKAVTYAIREWGYEVVNPFAGQLISTRDQKAIMMREWRDLSPVEEKQLLLACEPLVRDIVAFALTTGMRQSEILRLNWHGTQSSHYPYISGDTVVFTPKAQKSNRFGKRILSDKALDIVARQPVVCDFVFSRLDHKIRRDTFHKLWNKGRTKAGLHDLRFHDLRKIAGQRMLEKTGDIVAVSYQLGHSDIRTTQKVYTREPLDRQRAAVAGL